MGCLVQVCLQFYSFFEDLETTKESGSSLLMGLFLLRQAQLRFPHRIRDSKHNLTITFLTLNSNLLLKHCFHSLSFPFSTCYHLPPPGIPPGICNLVLTWQSIPHPRARRKRQFPTPRTPHRPQIRCTSNRTGIRLASKEMVFATRFILNIAHTHKRPVNKLMAAF